MDLPDWGLRRVRAKIDTGARTSAIDVDTIEHLADGRIRFDVVARDGPNRLTKWITARPIRESIVKPSHGEPQERIVCETTMRIGPIERTIEISLVRRTGMLCRMLVGRTAIEQLAVVDPSRTYLLTPQKLVRQPRPDISTPNTEPS